MPWLLWLIMWNQTHCIQGRSHLVFQCLSCVLTGGKAGAPGRGTTFSLLILCRNWCSSTSQFKSWKCSQVVPSGCFASAQSFHLTLNSSQQLDSFRASSRRPLSCPTRNCHSTHLLFPTTKWQCKGTIGHSANPASFRASSRKPLPCPSRNCSHHPTIKLQDVTGLPKFCARHQSRQAIFFFAGGWGGGRGSFEPRVISCMSCCLLQPDSLLVHARKFALPSDQGHG